MELVDGVDVVDIDRFSRFVTDTPRSQLKTIFTGAELAILDRGANGAAGLAARFAAKEAVIKAIADVDALAADWREIEIRADAGVPRVRLQGDVATAARERGVVKLFVSMSHSRRTAIAQVVGTLAADLASTRRSDD
jgi:holo-[acyl-carrier protein] synthase